MKLKAPQPLQRRNRSAGGEVDLRDGAEVFDTAEHEVYAGPGSGDIGEAYRTPDDSDPTGGALFDDSLPAGGDGDRGHGRVRSGRPRFDIRNTWQILAGSILIPVGVASIILAWYGAAHARVDQQQIPYMVSGGFLGLGAIVAGALLYWAHWLYRIYDQADLHHHQLMRSQAELRDAILNSAGAGPDRNLNGSVSSPGGPRAQSTSGFLATPTGTNFHRADCPIVARHPSGLRAVGAREVDQLQPCRICDPLAGEA